MFSGANIKAETKYVWELTLEEAANAHQPVQEAKGQEHGMGLRSLPGFQELREVLGRHQPMLLEKRAWGLHLAVTAPCPTPTCLFTLSSCFQTYLPVLTLDAHPTRTYFLFFFKFTYF